MDKAPYDIAFWILNILVPRGICFDRLVEEELEHKLGSVKEQLKEILAYLEKEKQSNTIK